MAKTNLTLDKRYKSADNKFPIAVTISNNSKTSYISFQYRIEEKDWDIKNKEIKKACKLYNSNVENVNIRNYKNSLDVFLSHLSLEKDLKNYTAEELKSMYLNKDSKPKDLFFPYFIEFMELKKKENPGASTYDIYKNTLLHLLRYTRNDVLIKFNTDNDFIENCKAYLTKQSNGLKILDVNKDFLKDFKEYLTGNKNLAVNSISIQLRNIRAIINYIKNEHELITEKEYPFSKIQIKSVKKPKNECLIVNDLVTLFTYHGTPAENKYVKLFKLSFLLMGVNFKDMLYMQKKDIFNGRINFDRSKTEKGYSIKIIPEAEKIIEEFEGDEFVLNILENKLKTAKKDRRTPVYKDVIRETNKKLKKICDKLDINFEDLSTGDARHAFASLALEAGVEWKVVQYCLGHEVGDTLNIYNHSINHLIDEAQELLLYYIYNYNEIMKKREAEKESRRIRMLEQTIF